MNAKLGAGRRWNVAAERRIECIVRKNPGLRLGLGAAILEDSDSRNYSRKLDVAPANAKLFFLPLAIRLLCKRKGRAQGRGYGRKSWGLADRRETVSPLL